MIDLLRVPCIKVYVDCICLDCDVRNGNPIASQLQQAENLVLPIIKQSYKYLNEVILAFICLSLFTVSGFESAILIILLKVYVNQTQRYIFRS